jgi:hypothetical protein
LKPFSACSCSVSADLASTSSPFTTFFLCCMRSATGTGPT